MHTSEADLSECLEGDLERFFPRIMLLGRRRIVTRTQLAKPRCPDRPRSRAAKPSAQKRFHRGVHSPTRWVLYGASDTCASDLRTRSRAVEGTPRGSLSQHSVEPRATRTKATHPPHIQQQARGHSSALSNRRPATEARRTDRLSSRAGSQVVSRPQCKGGKGRGKAKRITLRWLNLATNKDDDAK